MKSIYCWHLIQLTFRRYMGRIQDKDEDYYSQFQIVICGLDSIEARRWINAMLVSLVDDESPESLIPMVDGGTEGKELNLTMAGYLCTT
jgi:NEDD8-activating enzyme E1